MLAAIALAGAISLGGSLGLAPDDRGPAPSEEGHPAAPAESPQLPPGAAATAAAIIAAAILAGRRLDPGGGLRLEPPDDTIVVFVPGHGQGHGSEVFAELIELMGLDPEDVRYFDYRWVTGQSDPVAASQRAPVGPAAGALNAFLAGVGAEGDPIWVVGFSKGGATVAKLLAMWDGGAHQPPADVQGAVLLDPPLAGGMLGELQSVGTLVGWLPDDGGYDPVECAFLGFGCRDTRVGLGDNSGVEVLVIRNPLAGVTNFSDRPDGLRVVDAPDDGLGPLGQLFENPLALPGRISDAHESVLSDPAVALCILEEMDEPGSCSLEAQLLPSLRPPIRLSTIKVV